MAKKPLTPEQAEIKAMKKAKKSENWTKFWAVLLAAVLTFAVVSMGKTAAKDAIEEAMGTQTEQSGEQTETPEEDPWAETPSTGDNNTTTTPGTSGDNNTTTPGGSTSTPSGDTNAAAATAADAVKAVNDATAKAAKASYKWTRDAKFTKDVAIDPSFLTSTVDGIIKGIDENSSLNSVVGGFLGIPGDGVPKTANVTNGKLPEEGMGDDKYLLVATTLKEAHVEKFQVNGNTYKIQLKNSTTPTGNKATAIENASNDYITVAEVNENIASFTTAISVKEDGTVAEYTNIMLVAVIENGNLTSLEISYNLSATLNLSIGAKGTGAAKISAKYTDFKY